MDRKPQPDRGYSWLIALCCSYMHFALFGLFRSAGVVYVALIEMFHVHREEASWPFAICAGVFQLTAPVTSILTMYMSLRQVALLASFIATTGIAACYFASNITWIILFYGVVHGIGFGIITTIIPVVINQYFVKHQATAIGIAFAGGTLSSMIFPIIMEWMLYKYTLKESFLLLSGIAMNMLVASSLLRVPPWLQKGNRRSKLVRDSSEGKDSGLSISDDARPRYGIPAVYSASEKDIEESNTTQLLSKTESFTDGTDLPFEGQDDTVFSNDSVLFGGSNSKINVAINLNKDELPGDFESNKNEDAQKPLMNNEKIFIMPAKDPTHLDKPYHGNNIRHLIIEILREPIFYLITFTMGIFFYGAFSFFIIVVDYAKDKGISETNAVYVMSMLSLTDLIGRAGLGWITDRGIMKRNSMIALNLATLSAVYNSYPFVDSLTSMLLVAAIHGIALGSSITLFFIMMGQTFGNEKYTLAIGLNSFFNGIMSFSRPFIIGLFRDVVGSYDLMFHFTGTITFVFASIWFFQVFSERRRENQQKKDDERI